ncbi:MAG TPA: ankyrin repeat domain-containing protein [Pyrinomonadaceae bacterium]|nr:ankyrin repeat domain-containing protein [Pyrinomonadaceae bacterium]
MPRDPNAWTPASEGATPVAPFAARWDDEGPREERPARSSLNAPLFFLLLLLIVGGSSFIYLRGAAANKEPAWREYKPAHEGFAVRMPGETVVKEMTINVSGMGPVPGKLMSAELGANGECAIGYFDYGRYTADLTNADFEEHAQGMLDAGADSVVAGVKFKPLSRKSITLDGYQGLEMEGTPPDEVKGRRPLYHTFRIYLVPPRLYFISVVGPVTGALYKEKETFLDSFRLLSLDESRAAGAKLTTRDAEAYNEAREWLDAASRDYASTVRKLIREGADVDQVVGGETALTIAAQRGHTDVVKALIDAGADLDIRNKEQGATALWLATVECRNADIVRLLVGAGADASLKSRDGDTPLQSATRRGCQESVQALGAEGDD